MPFNGSFPLEERVDTILSYFNLPKRKISNFKTLYLDEPDIQGHKYGPDNPWITQAVAKVAKMIGRVIKD